MRAFLAAGVLALDLWALLSVSGSGASRRSRLIWTLLIVLVPILGAAAWAARRTKKAVPA